MMDDEQPTAHALAIKQASRMRGVRNRQKSLYRVSGEILAMEAIAERSGITPSAAYSRISRIRRLGRAVTWDDLRPTG